jgi:hypothetical protein
MPSGLGQRRQVLHQRRDGESSSTRPPSRLPGIQSSKAGAARFGDVDNDGDLDLLVGDDWTGLGNSGALAHLYINDGYRHLRGGGLTPLPTHGLRGPAGSTSTLLDMDGDFDLDLFVNHALRG